MTNHPITPPPKRFKQWEDDILNERDNVDHVLDCAWKDGFRAGADHELEACRLWVSENESIYDTVELLEVRRPSLKELALAALDDAILRGDCITTSDALPIIRRALEQLDD